MRLEIISRYPEGAAHPVPLLFVHGAFAGADVWDVHYLPYFARNGYAAHAVSLRGHGRSAGRERLRWHSLADYVEDLAEAARTLPRPPVLIGHSMGGMIVQKYLEDSHAAGFVLMASVPPHGLLPSLAGTLFGDPLLFQQIALILHLGPRFADLSIIRRALFSASTPDSHILAYLPLLQGESQRATLDMLGFNPLRARPAATLPVLVLGAERDALVSTAIVRDTGQAYGVDAVTFPDMGHAMMLEVGWRKAADHVLGWLETTLPAAEQG